jgi:hypothetical protein
MFEKTYFQFFDKSAQFKKRKSARKVQVKEK